MGSVLGLHEPYVLIHFRLMPHSTKKVTDHLNDFLAGKQRVLAFTGPWGKGKTYRWREWVKALGESSEQWVPTYCCQASLFGVREVGEIYAQLALSQTPLRAPSTPGRLKRVWAWVMSWGGWREAPKIIRDAELSPFGVNASALLTAMEKRLVRKALVCLDDLERKHPDLPIESVLGLVNELVEEKGCKVILIYNDDELDEETQGALSLYREKLIDRQLTYTPSRNELRRVVWPEDAPEPVRDVLEQAGVENIRVMRLVEAMLDYFAPAFRERRELWIRFQAQATRIAVLHYCYSQTVSLDDLAADQIMKLHLDRMEFEKTGQETKEDKGIRSKLECLRQVGYDYAQDFDALVIQFLRHGQVDFDAQHADLNQLQVEAMSDGKQANYHAFWDAYRSHFQVDEVAWVSDLIRFTEDNAEHLSLRNIDSVATFVATHELSTHDFEPLLTAAIERRARQLLAEHPEQYLPREDNVIGYETTGLHKRLAAEIRRLRNSQAWTPLRALIATSTPANGWNSADLEPLHRLSVAEWIAWLRNETHAELIGLLREFFGRFTREHPETVRRLATALREGIAPTSKFNRLRVEQLLANVELPELAHGPDDLACQQGGQERLSGRGGEGGGVLGEGK